MSWELESRFATFTAKAAGATTAIRVTAHKIFIACSLPAIHPQIQPGKSQSPTRTFRNTLRPIPAPSVYAATNRERNYNPRYACPRGRTATTSTTRSAISTVNKTRQPPTRVRRNPLVPSTQSLIGGLTGLTHNYSNRTTIRLCRSRSNRRICPFAVSEIRNPKLIDSIRASSLPAKNTHRARSPPDPVEPPANPLPSVARSPGRERETPETGLPQGSPLPATDQLIHEAIPWMAQLDSTPDTPPTPPESHPTQSPANRKQ